MLRDLPGPITSRPKLTVTLRNAHPFPISGTVGIEAKGLRFEPAAQPIHLAGSAEGRFDFPVIAAEPSGGNRYPAKVTVKTGVGVAELDEPVSVATIVRGTPTIDGEISEWQQLKAVPIFMAKGDPAWFEKVRPWESLEDFLKNTPEFAAEIAFAADTKYLYVMARVKDKSRKLLPSILAGRNLHKMQNPPADYVYHTAGPWPERDGDSLCLYLGQVDRKEWVPRYEVYPPDSPLYRFGAFLPTLYHYIIYPAQEGGAEILRTRTPEFSWVHPLPMDYRWIADHCRVEGAKVVVNHLDEGYVYEAGIPWSELKTLPHAAGDRIRLNARVCNANDRTPLAWAGSTLSAHTDLFWSEGRSISSFVAMDFLPPGVKQWSAETEWGFAGED